MPSPRARWPARLAEALARWRVPLGFASALLVLWAAAPTRSTVTIGASIAAIGEAIRIWAAGHLNKSREVTSSGPYRWTAHPLYVGSVIMGIGLAVACASVVAAAIVGAYLAVTLTAAIAREERDLRQAFGDTYDHYRRGPAAAGGDRRFSAAQAIANREYRAVVGLVIVVLLLAWKATYNEVFWRSAGPPACARAKVVRASARLAEAPAAAKRLLRAVSSVVEHRLYTPAVTGSNPVPPMPSLGCRELRRCRHATRRLAKADHSFQNSFLGS
jgi:protein-S-isoprenylcysteine O-methyltransferase Ste14